MNPPRDPDYVGAGSWRAWRVKPATEDPSTGVAAWLLHCPGAHAFWSYWWIMLIHLRPVEGAPPAVITTPGAGWEVICAAQQPDVAPNADEVKGTLRYLTPFDWVVQFGDVKDDAKAIEVVEAVVQAIMTGQASPDSDWRRYWQNAIPATARCHATHKHARS